MIESQINYFSKSRVEAFSDGIFSVIITLLVLEIRIPHLNHPESRVELAKALLLIVPKVLSWMVSFLIVCVIWVNHHQIFIQLKHITHAIFWLNANLLLWCTMIPFPTALIGDYLNNPGSLITFGIILSFMAIAFCILRINILKNRYVLNDDVNIEKYKSVTRKSIIFGPALYLTGALSSLIHPYLALAIYFFIPGYFIFSAKNLE
jgi:uncharacterized membrane protein